MNKQVFYFTERQIKHSRMYGCSVIECKIYKIKHNLPEYIGKVEYNTASNPGNFSVVFQWLIENKFISKKLYRLSACEWRAAGYYTSEVEEKGCIIKCLSSWY